MLDKKKKDCGTVSIDHEHYSGRSCEVLDVSSVGSESLGKLASAFARVLELWRNSRVLLV